MEHYQCRLVKRLDGRKIITFRKLGKMYAHEQKTLKSYHTLDEAITEACKFNPSLPLEVKGIVIVRFRASGGGTIVNASDKKPFVRITNRKLGTSVWLRFIDRSGEVYELSPDNHEILKKA